MVATTGALLFLPCLGYSVSRHVDAGAKGDARVLSGVLAGAVALDPGPRTPRFTVNVRPWSV